MNKRNKYFIVSPVIRLIVFKLLLFQAILGISTWNESATLWASPNLQAKVSEFDQKFAKQYGKITLTCDTKTLQRRLHLDICGSIPTYSDYKDQPLNRTRLDSYVTTLLKSHKARSYEAYKLSRRLLPKPPNELSQQLFQRWLKKQLRSNKSWAKTTETIITSEGPVSGEQFAGVFFLQFRGDPAETATTVARQFLGRSLECARCHDHPFAEVSQEQFHQFAANFARVRTVRKGNRNFEVYESPIGEYRFKLLNGEKARIFKPHNSHGKVLVESNKRRRQLFQSWLKAQSTASDFVRATVNRVFSEIIGLELVGPVDDIAAPSTDNELMQFCCQFFIHCNYELDQLRRLLYSSRAYQRARTVKGPLNTLRPLKPIVVANSLLVALNRDKPAAGELNFLYARMRQQFIAHLEKLGASAPENARFGESLRQALFLQNDPMLQSLTLIKNHPILKQISANKSQQDTLHQISLLALGRKAKSSELSLWLKYVNEHGIEGYEDILWALLSSSEFVSYR